MRFSKRDITTLASRMTWRKTTALGQVRTEHRRYVASPEEAMAILLSWISIPFRVEDLEQRFYRSKGAINEIFYETLECFLKWASPLVGIGFSGKLFAEQRKEVCKKNCCKES
jgi:hypothetical protein